MIEVSFSERRTVVVGGKELSPEGAELLAATLQNAAEEARDWDPNREVGGRKAGRCNAVFFDARGLPWRCTLRERHAEDPCETLNESGNAVQALRE